MKNLAFLLALHSVDGLGPVRLKRLLEYYKDPKVAWEKASLKDLLELGIYQATWEKIKEARKKLDPIEYTQNIKKSGIKLMTIFDPDYPESLTQIYDPPIVIYYQGEFKKEDKKALAVVGTRKMTGYGRAVTEKFTAELVAEGFTIVSGLARGVDTTAHQTAVNNRGRTIAVLGGGLNKLFPSENTRLAEKIAAGFGVVMSEFPPDHPALAGNFPARNRIVAGLSLGVLVTEADQDSGSLITARLGLDQGKEVFAVPGPITSNLSKGPADLIKDGAKLTFETQDILDELGIVQSSKLKVKSENIRLSAMEETIINCLINENKHIDEICRSMQKPASEIAATLIKLEIMGVVKNMGSGVYCKVF